MYKIFDIIEMSVMDYFFMGPERGSKMAARAMRIHLPAVHPGTSFCSGH